MIDRRLMENFSWALLLVVLALIGVGILNLYSASVLRTATGMEVTPFYQKQMIWCAFGLLAMTVFVITDYRHFLLGAWPFYILCLLLLCAVPVWGKVIYGARRWLDLGFFNLQPTEPAKIAVMLLAAKVMSRIPGRLDLKTFAMVLAIGLLPAGLVILQPDLGSGLTILFLLGGMVLYKGLTRPLFKSLLVIVPLLVPCAWFVLHDYQKKRILSFLNPEGDPLGAGYHIIQSRIAVGSGRFWGKGFMEGTQSQLQFLPEKHTDFALAVWGEEWGFVGCLFLLALFCIFLYQVMSVSQESKDSFGSYLCAGVFFYFFWQILINMGMVLGIMPVVGIPLPFISYGGSSMLVNLCLVGIVLNVSMRRYVFKQP